MTVARKFGPIQLANEDFHFDEAGCSIDSEGREEGEATVVLRIGDGTDMSIMVKWCDGGVYFTGYEYSSYKNKYKERVTYDPYGFEVDL